MYLSSLLIIWIGFLTGGYNEQSIPDRQLMLRPINGDTIIWTPGYRLRVEDFTGSKAEKLKDRTGNDTSGRSCVFISYRLNVKDRKLQIETDAMFIKSRSYIVGEDSLRTLKHEQAHFDITKIYAIKLEKLFNEMPYKPGAPIFEILDSNYKSISNEAIKKHDDFDLACRGDLTKQLFYDWIQQELDKYYKK